MFRPESCTQTVSIKRLATVTTTKITTNREGERHVYHSLDEMPPDQRAEVERLSSEALSGKGGHLFRVRDASGQERTYNSLEKMPPEIRVLVERIQRESDSK